MKRTVIRIKKPEHKLLEGESDKLKEKLDLLKKQIEAKKREKHGQLKLISATEPLRQPVKEPLRESSREALGQAGLSGLEGSRRSHLGNIEIEGQLREVLAELNIEKISMKLKEKGVTSLEEFRNINSQELQSWKDLAVGYRIKIRKYLDKHPPTQPQSSQSSQQPSPEKQEPVRDIEEIMRIRKEEQVFIPINRRHEEEGALEHQQELAEEEQEAMMLSLMAAFKGQSAQEITRRVELDEAFDQGVDSAEETEQNSLKQPALGLQSGVHPLMDHKYCWLCLRMLKDNSLSQNGQPFCSDSCIEQFNSSQFQETSPFYNKVSEVEQQFANHLKAREQQTQEEQEQEQEELNFDMA